LGEAKKIAICLDAGMDSVLQKPIRPAELRELCLLE
jgi:CheY-like chemotaxis protein